MCVCVGLGCCVCGCGLALPIFFCLFFSSRLFPSRLSLFLPPSLFIVFSFPRRFLLFSFFFVLVLSVLFLSRTSLILHTFYVSLHTISFPFFRPHIFRFFFFHCLFSLSLSLFLLFVSSFFTPPLLFTSALFRRQQGVPLFIPSLSLVSPLSLTLHVVLRSSLLQSLLRIFL